MESGNYSSLQSSSGGGDDQEFNSQALESVSSFLNSSYFLPTPNPQSSFPSARLTTPFDNLTSDYIQSSFPQQSQSQPNLNPNSQLIQPRGPTSDQQPFGGAYMSQSSMQAQSSGTVHIGSARASGSSDQQQQTSRVVRNTKKRTRASRRAPTTVLTTDTTNFRAMVQEFTGVPEPPFSGSRRLDLFGFGSGSGSSLRSANHVEPMVNSYPPPARALSHNAQPFVNNNSLVHSIGNFPNNANALYQHPSGQSMQNQVQHMLSMQNQNQNQSLNSQLLFQSSVPDSLNVPSFGTMSQLGSNAAAAFGNQGQLGVSHGHVNHAGFSGLQSHAADRLYDVNQAHQMRSSIGNYAAGAQCNNSSNLNMTAASGSNVQHGRNAGNVASRGEGTSESWIFR